MALKSIFSRQTKIILHLGKKKVCLLAFIPKQEINDFLKLSSSVLHKNYPKYGPNCLKSIRKSNEVMKCDEKCVG